MKMPLKAAVKTRVQAVRLDSARLSALQELQNRYPRQEARKNYGRYGWYAMAGIAATLLVIVTLLFTQPGVIPENDTLVAEIAAEVVKNHLKLKPLEVRTDSLEGIRDYFTRLDFQPVASAYLKDIGLELLGGRYCSLQNVTAAQLRFGKMGSDTVHTLYQVGYDPVIFKQLPDFDQGETPVSTYANGIKVTLWVEKGLLFALTED
jgi:hypothetical protein